MKKTLCLFAAVILSVAVYIAGIYYFEKTEQKSENIIHVARLNAVENVDGNVDDLLDRLDFGNMQSILDMLSSDQIAVFGSDDIVSRIKSVANGEFKTNFGNVFTYVLALLGANVFEFLPMLIGCLTIILAYSVINSIKGKFASDAIESVVYFATGMLAMSLVVGYFSSVMVSAVTLVASVKTQINASSPILLTIMTATGATSSASVYTPSVAVLGSGMTNIVSYIAFPALLMSIIFDIIGSVSTGIKLDNMAEFLRSACKWFLGTAFFVFMAIISISGITASVQDGISVRAAKFAMSKYVPVIGGYLSQGFDFVLAGNVLIKNAIGTSAIVLMALYSAPIICKLAVFTLTLKLTAAIAEPMGMGGNKFGGMLIAISKSSSAMTAIVFAMTFLYILFLTMIIGTGNISL